MRKVSGLVLVVAVMFVAQSGWSQDAATPEKGAAGDGLWLSISVDSPSVSETIQVKVPLSAISKLVKALPETVKQDLEEKKIPYNLIEVAAESFVDYDPLTILDHEDDSTGDHVQVKTVKREETDKGKTSHFLKGVIVYPAVEEKAGSKTEFTLPLTAVERIARQLKEFKLPLDLLGEPEEMQIAIEAFVSELQVSPPGDIAVIKTAKQDIHVWTE